MFQVSVS